MGDMPLSSPSDLPLSPCTGVCRLDGRGLCIGCLRTGDEIARWSSLKDAERLRIMDEILPLREPC
jgi:predicted Fe-S protein YdhL (DUF1289 family)